MQRVSSLVVLTYVCACSGSVAHTETARPEPQSEPAAHEATEGELASTRAGAQPLLAEPDAGPGVAAPASPAEPHYVDGGEISRARLLAVLEGGVGRFLQNVRVEPHLVAGRFVGWRLVSVFGADAAAQSGALRPGDTVMRVNGQSIERPEQFKSVWDVMATQSELVLQVQRAGKHTKVRYRIVDNPGSDPPQSSN
jgi:hypothetical protein